MDLNHHFDNEPDVLGELSPPSFEYYHGSEGRAGDPDTVQHQTQVAPAKMSQHQNPEWKGTPQKNAATVTPVGFNKMEIEKGHVSSLETVKNAQIQNVESQSVFPVRVYKNPSDIEKTANPPPPQFGTRDSVQSYGSRDRFAQAEGERRNSNYEDDSSSGFGLVIDTTEKSKLLATPSMSVSTNMNLLPFMCPTCQKTFPTALKLRQHIACHSLEKTFICDICGRGFARKQTLTRHIMHRHVTEKPHVCPICSKGYPQKYLLKQHMLKHSADEQKMYNVQALEYDKVDYAAIIASTLKENSTTQDSESKDGSETSSSKDTIIYKSDDGEASQGADKSSTPGSSNQVDRPHKCEICGKRFAEKVILDQHMINHSVGKPYKCNLCDTEFILHRMLVKHCMTVHLGDRPYVCEICNQAFGKTSTLKRHMFTHSKVKPHSCNVCGRAFTREYSLQLHMANHTGEKPFKCADCGKGFASNSRLTMHFRSQHVEIAKFGCAECGMTFAQEINLKKHAAKKHGAPSETTPGKKNQDDDNGEHKCKICEKLFSAKSTLNRHLLMHSLERPFVCEYCDKRFTAQIGLTQHMFIHADDNPYTCKDCGKGFTHRKGLQGHMMLHTGELPHVCDICGEGFRRLDSLRRHKMRDHIETGDPGDKNVAQLFRGPKPAADRYEKLDVKKYFGMSKLQKAGKVTDSGNEQGDSATTTSDQADGNDSDASASPYSSAGKSKEDPLMDTEVSAELDEYVRKTISACEKNLSLVHDNFPLLSEKSKSAVMQAESAENPEKNVKDSPKTKSPGVKRGNSESIQSSSAKVKKTVVQEDVSEPGWRA